MTWLEKQEVMKEASRCIVNCSALPASTALL